MAEFVNFRDWDLERILSFLNANLSYDTLSETILREKLVDDPDFDPELTLTLWQDDKLVGVMAGIVRGGNGYIKFMAIHSDFRGQGLAERMLRRMEKLFSQRGCDLSTFGYSPPNYLTPGLDIRYSELIQFLTDFGYEKQQQVNLYRITVEDFLAKPQPELPPGLKILRAGYEDMSEVLNLASQKYPQFHFQLGSAYNSLPVSLFLVKKNGVIAGFGAHNTNNFGTGWLGPLALEPSDWQTSIPQFLLMQCLQDIKEWQQSEAFWPVFQGQPTVPGFTQLPAFREFEVLAKKIA